VQSHSLAEWWKRTRRVVMTMELIIKIIWWRWIVREMIADKHPCWLSSFPASLFQKSRVPPQVSSFNRGCVQNNKKVSHVESGRVFLFLRKWCGTLFQRLPGPFSVVEPRGLEPESSGGIWTPRPFPGTPRASTAANKIHRDPPKKLI